jgi:hypothetical protein
VTQVFNFNFNFNFLTCLEYLNEYDDFFSEYLSKFQYCGFGNTNFLSHHSYDKFYSIMATLVRNIFIAEEKDAKHFSVIADSISHADHMSEEYFQKMFLYIYYQTRVASWSVVSVLTSYSGYSWIKSHSGLLII